MVPPMKLHYGFQIFHINGFALIMTYFRGLLGEIPEVINNLRAGQDAGGQAGEDAA